MNLTHKRDRCLVVSSVSKQHLRALVALSFHFLSPPQTLLRVNFTTAHRGSTYGTVMLLELPGTGSPLLGDACTAQPASPRSRQGCAVGPAAPVPPSATPAHLSPSYAHSHLSISPL